MSACGGVVGASACGASFWLSVIGGGVMLVRGGVVVRCGPEGASWCGVVWCGGEVRAGGGELVWCGVVVRCGPEGASWCGVVGW